MVRVHLGYLSFSLFVYCHYKSHQQEETFEPNPEPQPQDGVLMQRTYKSDLFPPLRSGERLCQMINIVKPGSVAKIIEPNGKPFLMLENINFFIEAAR